MRFNTFPIIPNAQIIGNTIPYESFLKFSVRKSSSGFIRWWNKEKIEEKKMKKIACVDC
jgi:hypothetical protein